MVRRIKELEYIAEHGEAPSKEKLEHNVSIVRALTHEIVTVSRFCNNIRTTDDSRNAHFAEFHQNGHEMLDTDDLIDSN